MNDHYARIACAFVWADRRVGESHYDAAERAAQAINQPDMDARKLLEMACIERADKLIVNRLRTDQKIRNGSGVLRSPTDEEIHDVLQKLRAEVGLADIDYEAPAITFVDAPPPEPEQPRDELRHAENRVFFQDEIARMSAESKRAKMRRLKGGK